MNKAVDTIVEAYDKAIADTEELLDFLNSQRRSAIEYQTGSKVGDLFYAVGSRSGGSGHRIHRDSMTGKFTCSCPAGTAGRTCWAKRGILASVDNTGQVNGTIRGFYDDDLVYHDFGMSNSLREACRQVNMEVK